MNISDILLNTLICPKCQKKVRLSKNGQHLECESCMLSYNVSENTPIMLIDSALPITSD